MINSHHGAAAAPAAIRGARAPLLWAAALMLTLSACSHDRSAEPIGTPAASTEADAPPPTGRAVIDFAQFRGRIKDWRAVRNEALLIEDSSGNWYRADFMSPCHGLPFTDAIGFVTDATNQIDRFSSIMVRHERCWFRSFQRVEAPQ